MDRPSASSLRQPRQHDDLLNYQFKRLLTLGGAPAVRLCEGGFGIPRLQWRLLAALVEAGPVSPSGLVERTGVEQARASKAVASLVAKRLVVRETHSSDHRRATLRATPAGIALYEQLFPQLAAINQRLASVLTDAELLVLEECLRKLTAQARAVLAEGGGVSARADRRQGGSQRIWDARGPAATPCPDELALALRPPGSRG